MKRLAIAGLTFLAACAPTPTTRDWKGFVYPDAPSLLVDIPIGDYTTLEDCRAASLAVMKAKSVAQTGDYECGFRCRIEPGMSASVCEKTER